MSASAAPALTLIEDPLSGFDGELTRESMEFLIRRVGELDEARRQAERAAAEAADTAKGHEHTLRSQSATITRLKRNREREMKRSRLYPQAERCWGLHRSITANRSPRSRLTPDRFELIAPFLRGGEADEFDPAHQGPPRNALEECIAAIVGRHHDHFVTRRANGTLKHHWGWELTFRSAEKFDESRDRRPRDWRARAAEHLPEAA